MPIPRSGRGDGSRVETLPVIRNNDPNNYEAFARIHAWIGNNDLAFDYIDKMIEVGGPEVLRFIIGGGFYDKLETDPRYDTLLRKHGMHPNQQPKISFNFTPPE